MVGIQLRYGKMTKNMEKVIKFFHFYAVVRLICHRYRVRTVPQRVRTVPHHVRTVPHRVRTAPHRVRTVPHRVHTVPYRVRTVPCLAHARSGPYATVSVPCPYRFPHFYCTVFLPRSRFRSITFLVVYLAINMVTAIQRLYFSFYLQYFIIK